VNGFQSLIPILPSSGRAGAKTISTLASTIRHGDPLHCGNAPDIYMAGDMARGRNHRRWVLV